MKYFLFIIIVTSCSTHKKSQEFSDDYLILNQYLKDKGNLSLIKESYFNGNITTYFSIYQKWHKISVENKNNFNEVFFSKNQEWIFDIEDIKYMKKEYKVWKPSEWDKSKIPNNVNLIDNKGVKYGIQENVRISYPLYNQTKSKAMIIVNKNSSPLNGSVKIILFKKIMDYGKMLVYFLFL